MPDCKEFIQLANSNLESEIDVGDPPGEVGYLYDEHDQITGFFVKQDDREEEQYDLDEQDHKFIMEIANERYQSNANIFAAKFCIPPQDNIKYYVYQRELCPETKRIHIQGYIEFSKVTTLKQALASLPNKMRDIGHHTDYPFYPSLRKRRGTQQQAIDYCKR